MKIIEVIRYLETIAPPVLQEDYDNAGLLTGNPEWECTGVLCTLDTTEDVVKEAVIKKCNLIVSHHPILFRGLKKINGSNYVERVVIAAIKQDIAIYAIHTNLDNVLRGVNGEMAKRLGLTSLSPLAPKKGMLKKIYTFVPVEQAELVRNALFGAGGGHIGNYSECSFNEEGEGTFKAGRETNPYVGEAGKRHTEKEIKIEMVFPGWLEGQIVQALKSAHPYEEVAFDIITLSNEYNELGSGLTGMLPAPLTGEEFLELLRQVFSLKVIRYTSIQGKKIQKVALCGGAGSFLISNALLKKAEAYVSSDIKYHEFFDADGQLLLADIGHYESEQFTIDFLQQHLQEKFTTFAVLKTGVITNPVHYFI